MAGFDSRRAIAIALGDLADLAVVQGDVGRAAVLAEEALAHARAVQHLDLIAELEASVGTKQLRLGNLRGAARHLGEGLRVAQALDDEMHVAHGLTGAAAVCLAGGDAVLATRLSAAARGVLDVMGAPGYEAALQDATATAARAALGQEAFAAAWTAGQEMSREQAIATALATLAPVESASMPPG
jgi:hypothetical protein